jgi:phage FluMu protein Com
MPIEFRCSQCGQLLRVPETAAGKSARCPKCQALMTVPGVATAVPESGPANVGPVLPATASQADLASPPPAGASVSPSLNPFASDQPATSFPPPPPKPPASGPFAPGPADHSLNPYASPAAADTAFSQGAVPSTLPIHPTRVAADAVFNYAWQIWKANLGLLLGVTVTVVGVNIGVGMVSAGMETALRTQGNDDAATAVSVFSQLVTNILQIYLGIGAAQINLKLARRQPAEYGDLFGGIGLFLPVLGSFIIAYLGIILGLLCLIVPAILMVLAFWPFYYLIIDRKAGVIESFSVANRITNGNWGSSFLLWLMSTGIIILGCLAACVGILFAAPLVGMMFAVAYLMMSGQLMPYGGYPSYPPPYQPAPQG